MEAAIKVGHYIPALDSKAMEQLQLEVSGIEMKGQARVVLWDDIKDNPPKGMKISRVAMIPHKSRKFRAILNVSYTIKLMEHTI